MENKNEIDVCLNTKDEENMSKSKLENIKNVLDILTNCGYLLFCVMIGISGLMLFGASVKYHFLFNVDTSQLLYFLFQAGFFIVICFLIICYVLSPLGYFIYWVTYHIITVILYVLHDTRQCLKNKKMISWNEYKSQKQNLVEYKNIFTHFRIILGALIFFAIISIFYLYISEIDFLYACIAASIVFSSIDIAINSLLKRKSKFKLNFIISYIAITILFSLLIPKTGYYLFELYLSVTGGLKSQHPILMLDKDCVLKNAPIFNQYESSTISIISNKTESSEKSYHYLMKEFFNNDKSIASQFLESYSIIQTESNITYIKFYNNKFIYVKKFGKTIDLSDCSMIKVLN